MEKFNRNIVDLINSTETNNDSSQLYSFNYLSKFKTYYPKECFDLNEMEKDDDEEDESDTIKINSNLCPPPPPPPPPSQPLPQSSDSIVPAGKSNSKSKNVNSTKLKLKKFLYNNSDYDVEQEHSPICFDNESDEDSNEKSGDSTLIFDHKLFSLFQLNEMKNDDAAPCPESFLNSSFVKINNEKTPIQPPLNIGEDEDSQDFTTIDDYYTQKLFQENTDSCDGLLSDENVFESNLIRLNMRPSLALNNEFNLKTNETSLNATSVKYALKNLQSILPKNNIKCEIKQEDKLQCDNKNMVSLPSITVSTIDHSMSNYEDKVIQSNQSDINDVKIR
jgi:hypothetical protein